MPIPDELTITTALVLIGMAAGAVLAGMWRW